MRMLPLLCNNYTDTPKHPATLQDYFSFVFIKETQTGKICKFRQVLSLKENAKKIITENYCNRKVVGYC